MEEKSGWVKKNKRIQNNKKKNHFIYRLSYFFLQSLDVVYINFKFIKHFPRAFPNKVPFI